MERTAEPEFELVLNSKLLEQLNISSSRQIKIKTIDDDGSGREITMDKKSFQALEDLLCVHSSLLEIHDNPAADNLVVSFHRLLKIFAGSQVFKHLFIPGDDIVNPAGVGNMNNSLPLNQPVESNLHQAGCLSYSFA